MLRTNVNRVIKTKEDAEAYLTELFNNGESYHPEDNAHDIIWNTASPTSWEKKKLNRLMKQVNTIPNFDPCDFLNELFKQ